MTSGGKSADIMHAFAKTPTEYVVFDFARVNDAQWLPWNVMENMKNGWLTTTKYCGKMIRFRAAKIVCFMNQEPPMDKFTKDRYKMFYLRNDMK